MRPLKNKRIAEIFGTFWLAPIVGAALAGIVYPLISGEPKPKR